MSLDNPFYYTGDTVEITNDPTSLKTLYRNAGISTFADVFVNTIDELKFKDIKKTTLKFIAKNAAGNVITKSYEVIVNPDNETFTVPGVAADLLGSTAVSVAVGGALTLAVGPGAAIIFAAAGSVFLWDAIKKDVDVVDDFFDELNNTVDTNIELAGLDGKTIGGVFYKEGLDQDDELQAVKQLLGRTVLPDFPDVSIGTDSIRVVNDANIDASDEIRDTYKIYDGELVDIIASEFNIIREELLFLGAEDGPNINREIQYNNQINPEKFVFANSENRFYVPLPVANSNEIDVKGFHPGNIYYGTDGNDDISVFENNTSFNSELETDNTLILGLEGDDFLSADVGTNFLFGGTGNDTLTGIAGQDTVYFTDDFANYDYSIDSNGVITFAHTKGNQADGIDTLIDIEQAHFRDRVVSLPLDEQPDETIENNDEITLVFKTTLNPSDPKTSLINIPQDIFGEAPTVEFLFTIGSNSFNEDKQTYDVISGGVKINGIPFTPRASGSNSELLISNFYTPNFTIDGFNLGISEMRNPTLPDDPGYQLATINFSLVDNDGGTLENGRLPTDWASFASDVDEYSVGITFANEELPGTQIAVIVNKTDPAISPFELYEIESTEEIAPDRPVEEETQDNAESEQPMDGEDSTEVVTDDNPTEQPPIVEEDTLLDEAFKPIVNDPLQTEIQLQLFAPDLESPVTEPLISTIRIPDEYTELSTLGLDTSDLAPVDVNIDIDFGAASVPGRISFEVDENEGSGSFAPGEFNGYVFTDVFDEIPAIENVTLSETANSLGLESSDITFTENTIEVNVESLAYSPGLNALLDVEFADL